MDSTVLFRGGVVDGQRLLVGVADRNPDELLEVTLTADGELWHIGAPAAVGPGDAGVQRSLYRYRAARDEYDVVDG